jgi:hypothetical protein
MLNLNIQKTWKFYFIFKVIHDRSSDACLFSLLLCLKCRLHGLHVLIYYYVNSWYPWILMQNSKEISLRPMRLRIPNWKFCNAVVSWEGPYAAAVGIIGASSLQGFEAGHPIRFVAVSGGRGHASEPCFGWSRCCRAGRSPAMSVGYDRGSL